MKMKTQRGAQEVRECRVKLGEYLFRQLEIIAEKASKTPDEMIRIFVAKRCNAPTLDTTRIARFFNAREVQCTRAEKGGAE